MEKTINGIKARLITSGGCISCCFSPVRSVNCQCAGSECLYITEEDPSGLDKCWVKVEEPNPEDPSDAKNN